MADLIDRDAALAEIEQYKDFAHKIFKKVAADKKEKNFFEHCAYCEGVRDGWSDAKILLSNAPAVNRWISCSEALPASICRVLVTTFAGNVGVAVFNPEKKRWYKNGEFYDLRLIIAWQPMPDAYEPPESEVQE